MIAHYWVVYTINKNSVSPYGHVQVWGSAEDPNYSIGKSYTGESWLMIPPDGWECV